MEAGVWKSRILEPYRRVFDQTVGVLIEVGVFASTTRDGGLVIKRSPCYSLNSICLPINQDLAFKMEVRVYIEIIVYNVYHYVS